MLSFQKRIYDLGDHLINDQGTLCFQWKLFNPLLTIGESCFVSAYVYGVQPFSFECTALLLCEQTASHTGLGLHFLLQDQQLHRLRREIAERGILPDYVRKFPRIAFNAQIGVMPSRAFLTHTSADNITLLGADIENLSPNGVQVVTEDARAQSWIPESRVSISLLPRGDFTVPVEMTGILKRITFSRHPISKNKQFSLGFALTHFTDLHRQHFADLLRLIVRSLQR